MDDLSPEQLSELRDDLLSLQESVRESLSFAREAARTVDLDQPIGRLSRMDAMQNQQIAKAGLRSQQLKLKRIEVALAALDQDDYGLCRSCELSIDFRRLKARPESPFCLECAEEMERA